MTAATPTGPSSLARPGQSWIPTSESRSTPGTSSDAVVASGDAALLWILVMYFAARPALDGLPTFNVGPDLRAPVGLFLLTTTGAAFTAIIAQRPRWSVGKIAALSLAGAGILGSVGAAHFGNSSALALRVLTAALVFVVVEDLVRRRGAAALVPVYAAILAGFAIAGVLAVGQLADVIPLPPQARYIDGRPTGPFGAPTVLGTSMFIASTLTLALFGDLQRRRWVTVGLLATAGAFLGVLVANNSRGPFLAAALAVIVLAARHRRFDLILVAASVAAAVLALAPQATARLSELGGTDLVNGRNTLTFRFNVWRQALPRFFDSPIVGIGLGEVQQTTTMRAPPHNTTVQALVETGVLGLIAHLGLMAGLGLDLWRRTNDRYTGLHRAAVSAALAVGVGYAALSLSENLMTQLVTTGPVAAIVGAGLGVRANARV